MTPYLIGHRVKPVTDMDRQNKIPPIASLRAEDSGKVAQVLGWSAATFGAGAIIGWIAVTRSGNR
ncbi:MAG: hypothetical protein ACYCS8_16325 [Acidithiobacillus sp.]